MALETAEFLIVGGGIAGLSAALHLARAGHGKGIRLLDREELPGFYASGHNAGIGRQLTGRAEHTALTLAGRVRLHAAGLMDRSGGLLLGREPGATDALAEEARAFEIPVGRGPGATLPDLEADAHLAIPSDGIIDVDRLLHHCAEGARDKGAQIRFGCGVTGIQPLGDGFHVQTDAGPLWARYLVNAAGGWAQQLGQQAGGLDIAFQPLRRHLIWSPQPRPADHPWAWYVDRPLYLRPESGGLLLCACEEEAVTPPARGLQPEADPAILESLEATLRECAPNLAELSIGRLWSGLRTFAPDRRFVLGRDPHNRRLFWAAGLGGHGMTSGLSVGELVANVILERADAGLLSPDRLCPAATVQPS